MPRLPSVKHRDAVRALEKIGFRVAREGKHIVIDQDLHRRVGGRFVRRFVFSDRLRWLRARSHGLRLTFSAGGSRPALCEPYKGPSAGPPAYKDLIKSHLAPRKRHLQ